VSLATAFQQKKSDAEQDLLELKAKNISTVYNQTREETIKNAIRDGKATDEKGLTAVTEPLDAKYDADMAGIVAQMPKQERKALHEEQNRFNATAGRAVVTGVQYQKYSTEKIVADTKVQIVQAVNNGNYEDADKMVEKSKQFLDPQEHANLVIQVENGKAKKEYDQLNVLSMFQTTTEGKRNLALLDDPNGAFSPDKFTRTSVQERNRIRSSIKTQMGYIEKLTNEEQSNNGLLLSNKLDDGTLTPDEIRVYEEIGKTADSPNNAGIGGYMAKGLYNKLKKQTRAAVDMQDAGAETKRKNFITSVSENTWDLRIGDWGRSNPILEPIKALEQRSEFIMKSGLTEDEKYNELIIANKDFILNAKPPIKESLAQKIEEFHKVEAFCVAFGVPVEIGWSGAQMSKAITKDTSDEEIATLYEKFTNLNQSNLDKAIQNSMAKRDISGKQNTTNEKPPVAGARKSPKDGKWYIEKEGKFLRVEVQ
jgi:hypothetical protein